MSNTTYLGIGKVDSNLRQPEVPINSAFDDFDAAIAGYIDLSLQSASGNVVLDSATQARRVVIRLKDVPSGAVTIQIPATTGANAEITFVNACTGTYSTVTIKSTGANSDNANGVSLPTGRTRKVRHNGNSVFPSGAEVDSTTGDVTGGAWTSYTPTVTAGSGSFTTVSAVGKYKLLGKTMFVRITVTITTNGTAASSVNVTLPAATPNDQKQFIPGSESVATGKMLRGIVLPNTSTLICRYYDFTYPGADSNELTLEGVYEIA